MLTQADFEGQAYEFVKSFYLNVIQLQFQMEECHKMLTNQINWVNPEGDQARINVNQPLPLGGPPVPLMEFLTGGSLDISSILRDMILHHIEEKLENTCEFSVSPESKLIQDTGHLDHLPGFDKRMLSTAVKLWTRNLDGMLKALISSMIIPSLSLLEQYPFNNNEQKIMRFNEIYKFSDGSLTNILEVLDYRVKEYKVNQFNPGDSDVHTLEDSTLILEILSSFRNSDIKVLSKRSSIKVKGTSITTNNQAFTIKKGMSMPVQMSQAQDGERPQVDDQRLELVDDLKEAQDHISSTITSH
ncbi:hypothetical protein Tco_0797182 [Tanacetum coccineum]